jgi:putative tryptophan/tyrosine transport system substrate-binding protein
MKRREFITLLGGAAAWPLAARGQPRERMRRIGVLHQYSANDPEGQRRLAAFVDGLGELGWTEQRNVTFEIRYADGNFDRLATLVDELLAANVEVILTSGTEPVDAARKATKAIPIVMATIGDPVGAGIVASLARPGGNITGLSNLATDSTAKRVQVLHEIVPNLARVAALWNPDNASVALKFKEIEAACQKRGIDVVSVQAHRPDEIAAGFKVATESRVKAVIIADDVFLASRRSQIIALALQYRLPVSSEFRQFTNAGGLFSYGPNQIDMYRRAASYVDKIFKGARPADLPIEQPVRFELVINLKTAKALGLDVPLQVQQLADEVIE